MKDVETQAFLLNIFVARIMKKQKVTHIWHTIVKFVDLTNILANEGG